MYFDRTFTGFLQEMRILYSHEGSRYVKKREPKSQKVVLPSAFSTNGASASKRAPRGSTPPSLQVGTDKDALTGQGRNKTLTSDSFPPSTSPLKTRLSVSRSQRYSPSSCDPSSPPLHFIYAGDPGMHYDDKNSTEFEHDKSSIKGQSPSLNMTSRQLRTVP